MEALGTMKKNIDSDGNHLEHKEGFVVKTRDPEQQSLRDKYKMPYKCDCCSKFMEHVDDMYFYRWGVCSDCAINYLEDRQNLEHLKFNKDEAQSYVKSKIEQKKCST
jgi:hypothetical protein